MGSLRHLGTGRAFELDPETIVGRSSRCELRLTHDSVSHVHASLRWLGDAWYAQDRNSTNGTWLDGTWLGASERRRLGVGSVVRFGAKGAEEWMLADGSAPPPSIKPLPHGAPLILVEGLLALPPNGLDKIRWGADGAVLLEPGRAPRALHDGQEFEVSGVAYRAFLPLALPTAAFEGELQEVELRIIVDSCIEIIANGKTHRLPWRAPYVVLQALAEERLKDRAAGSSDADEGWLDRQVLADQLRRADLNQDIRRIRKQFLELELFQSAEQVIVSHRDQGKVRLGLSRIRVT